MFTLENNFGKKVNVAIVCNGGVNVWKSVGDTV